MKRILFIIPYIPYPLNSGGNQAFFNMIDYIRNKIDVSILLAPHSFSERKHIEDLKKIWNNVHFYIFTEKAPQVSSPCYYWILKKIKDSATRKIRRLLLKSKEKDLAREKTTIFNSYFKPLSTQYMEYVIELCKDFDIVQVEFYELISLGYLLPPTVTSIFVHHEIRYIHNENELPLFKKTTPIDYLYYKIAKDFEQAALKNYNYIIALTDTDKEILQNFIGENHQIYTSPAVVKLDTNKVKPFTKTTYRLTFVGSENHYPNLDAINWFVKEIIPFLREQKTKFKLQIIGSWKSKFIKELESQYPEIELVGFIEDLHSFLNGSILLVPIRIGSGMRMKILDGIIAHAPIITTTKGVEGLNFRNESECIISDTPQEFANSITHLLSNPDLQEKLATQANKQLFAQYDQNRMLERRLNLYNKIFEEKG